MVNLETLEPGIKVDLALGAEGLTHADIKRIIDGVRAEDMWPVTEADIKKSYATYSAFIEDDGARRLAGFARQASRDFLTTSDVAIFVSVSLALFGLTRYIDTKRLAPI